MGFGQISVKVGDEELEVNQFLDIIQRVKENCSAWHFHAEQFHT